MDPDGRQYKSHAISIPSCVNTFVGVFSPIMPHGAILASAFLLRISYVPTCCRHGMKCVAHPAAIARLFGTVLLRKGDLQDAPHPRQCLTTIHHLVSGTQDRLDSRGGTWALNDDHNAQSRRGCTMQILTEEDFSLWSRDGAA